VVHATLGLESNLAIGPFSPQGRFRPLRRVEYDKLIELGAFQDERIELLEGVLVPMNPIGPPHCSTVQKLTALLVPLFAGRASVRIQSPIGALELSEPEPDVAIVPLGDYDTAHPDVVDLLIEVAESSLSVDRGVKLHLYAACAIPEYWIVNLVDRRVEVYTDPKNGTYANVNHHGREHILRPVRFSDLEIPIAAFLK
jgi:Uma2 family endonuclease